MEYSVGRKYSTIKQPSIGGSFKEAEVELKLKSISIESIPKAISKVELYRYLNEPEEAESICRDIIAADPDNQLGIRMLGLCITDQFTGGMSDRFAEAAKLFQSLANFYERFYYTGLLHERRAKAQLKSGSSPHTVLVLFEEAMRCYEEAERICPDDNDEALLRWNPARLATILLGNRPM